MLSRGKVRTGVPGLFVRFDDGSREQYEDASEFLRRGIPVAFALNAARIGTPGFFTWQDLRNLIGLGRENGVKVSILNHSSDNWKKYLSGDPNVFANWNFGSWTFDDILAELDSTVIEQELGVAVTGYLQPGDVNPQSWIKHNKELIEAALKEQGFDFALGILQRPSADGTDGQIGSLFRNVATFAINPWADIGNLNQSNELRPGIIRTPFDLPDSFTADLGSLVVPRGVPRQGGGTPLPDPNSGADGWLLGEDNNGAGIEGSKTTDLGKTVQHSIARALGVGCWFGLAMHGKQRSEAENVALSTGTKLYPNHWSPRHLADLISRLREKGHVRTISIEEWASELFSDFEEGTDLVANPECESPMIDVGEDLFPDTIAPRGISTALFGFPVKSTSANMIASGIQYDANDRLETATSQTKIRTLIGRNVARLPRAGLRGGFILRPAEDTAAMNSATIKIPHVPAGLYRFDLESAIDSSSGDRISFNRYGVVASRQRFDLSTMIASAETVKDASIPEFCVLDSSEIYRQTVPPTTRPSRVSLFFDCNPARCVPQVFDTVTIDPNPAGIPASGSATISGVSVTGARRGARVIVRTGTALPAGVSVVGTVVAADTVDLVVYNDGAGTANVGSIVWNVYVEDLDSILAEPALLSTCSPWSFTISATISKDGPAEARFAEPRLTLLRRY